MKRSASRRVVITGMGVVSPLGCTVDLFWHLLSRGESAVKPITSFDTSPFQACLAAEVQDFDPEDFLHRKQARRMGRATQFAVASAMMAARDSGIDLEHEDRAAIGISIGTSIGGLKEAFDFHDAARQTAYGRVNPFTMGMTFPNAISSEVAIVLGLHGPCETYPSAAPRRPMPSAAPTNGSSPASPQSWWREARKLRCIKAFMPRWMPAAHWRRMVAEPSAISHAPSTRHAAAWCWGKGPAASFWRSTSTRAPEAPKCTPSSKGGASPATPIR